MAEPLDPPAPPRTRPRIVVRWRRPAAAGPSPAWTGRLSWELERLRDLRALRLALAIALGDAAPEKRPDLQDPTRAQPFVVEVGDDGDAVIRSPAATAGRRAPQLRVPPARSR